MKQVKLRPHKLDKLGKGYHPIFRTLDDKGRTLTYIVKFKDYNMEFNTMKKARLMAIKL